MSLDQYYAILEVLRRVIPENALLPRLLSGYTSTNARYVARLMAENVAPARTRSTRLVTQPSTCEPTTPEWVAMAKRKSNLYQQRAKLSNRFHDFPNDVTACADISREIRFLQIKIRRVHQEMGYYRVHGKMPEIEAEQERAVYTEAELMKQRQAVNSQMTRLRANLKQAATSKPAKVKKWQAQLTECEQQREVINGKIGQFRL